MRPIPRFLNGTKPRAYAAFDIASRRDLAALSIAIPMPEDEIWVDTYCWIPRGAIESKEPMLRDLYEVWEREGWLTVHSSQTTRFKNLLADFYQLAAETYEIVEVVYDPWQAEMFIQDLEDEGFTCREFIQGYRTYTPAIRWIESLIADRKLRHDGNPILRWAISNLKMDHDPAGNSKPNKPKSTAKIDPAVAMIMAASWAAEKTKKGEESLGLSWE